MKQRPSTIAVPRTREQIRKDVYEIRKSLGWNSKLWFDICYFIEVVLTTIDPDFTFIVLDDDQLYGRLAEAIPDQHMIRVKQSVYDGAVGGHFWHRMTLAHEVGHYMYHSASTVSFARLEPGAYIPREFDPEAQADAFAAELMMPVHLIRDMDYGTIAQKCGVSFSAAKTHLWEIKRIERNHLKKKNQKKKPRYSKRS